MTKTVSVVRSDTTFFIPARDVLAAWPAVSSEQTRYYLNGVYVETHDKEGFTVVATNGHVLLRSRIVAAGAHIGAAVTTQASSHDRGFILSLDVADKAMKAKTFGDAWLYGDTATGIVQVLDVGDEGQEAEYRRAGVLEFERISGTFPDWRRAMPSCTPGEAGAPVAVDMQNLEVFRKARKAYADDRMTCVRITAGALGEPMLVEFGGAPRLTGVVMPMRFNG
jgi:hypothetical protein